MAKLQMMLIVVDRIANDQEIGIVGDANENASAVTIMVMVEAEAAHQVNSFPTISKAILT